MFYYKRNLLVQMSPQRCIGKEISHFTYRGKGRSDAHTWQMKSRRSNRMRYHWALTEPFRYKLVILPRELNNCTGPNEDKASLPIWDTFLTADMITSAHASDVLGPYVFGPRVQKIHRDLTQKRSTLQRVHLVCTATRSDGRLNAEALFVTVNIHK